MTSLYGTVEKSPPVKREEEQEVEFFFCHHVACLRVLSRDPSVEAPVTNLVTMWVFGNLPRLPLPGPFWEGWKSHKIVCLCS